MQSLTNNTGIHVKISDPKKPDQRKFGEVRGLTGDMVKKIIAGYERLGALAPLDCRERATKLWKMWRDIIHFIDNNNQPTPEFQQLLKSWGEALLNTFEWKVLTAYTHIIVAHGAMLIQEWGRLSLMSQQGLEAANKLHKKIAKSASDHSKKNSIKQQFYHFYRLAITKSFAK